MAIEITRKIGGNIPPFKDRAGMLHPNAVIVLEYNNKWSEKEFRITFKLYAEEGVYGKDVFMEEFHLDFDEFSGRDAVVDDQGNVLDVGYPDYDALFKYMKFEPTGKISATNPVALLFLQNQKTQIGSENELLGKYWEIKST